MNIHDIIDVTGLFGVVLFLFAFYRTSIGRWTGRSLWYELDILISTVCLSVYAYSKGAYLSIAISAVWGIMAFKGLTSYAERRIGGAYKRRHRS
ncbi:MAG TPA: hypothetical protein VHD60_03480 [Candidatus Saccharimonadales bacterium]|nr:hypothetical protein [Candidatus Saccharimonadales bacterium]